MARNPEETNMNRVTLALITAMLVGAGCDYDVPLAEKQDIAIDPAVLGLWEQIPEKNETASPDDRMLVLKYTDTEYLIHYPTGKNGMFFRGYPVKVDGVTGIQIQLIGTNDNNADNKDRKYQVVSYRLSTDGLEIRTLNPELVDKNLKDSSKLREAFIKNKDSKNLFREPGKFKKMAEKPA